MCNSFYFLVTDVNKHVQFMKWKCKFCAFSSNGQGRIIQHYKERHGHHRRCSGLFCIYEDCFNTFQTQAELKKHLKEHVKGCHKIVTKSCCDLCTFSEPSNINIGPLI